MNISEFFHPGYGRFGLRAVGSADGAEYYYECLNRKAHTPFTSEQVWDFTQMAEFRLSQLDSKRAARTEA